MIVILIIINVSDYIERTIIVILTFPYNIHYRFHCTQTKDYIHILYVLSVLPSVINQCARLALMKWSSLQTNLLSVPDGLLLAIGLFRPFLNIVLHKNLDLLQVILQLTKPNDVSVIIAICIFLILKYWTMCFFQANA